MGKKPNSYISDAEKQKKIFEQEKRAAISQKDNENAARTPANHPDSTFGARGFVEIASTAKAETGWDEAERLTEEPAQPARCSMM